MLSPYTVLDLTDEKGEMASMVLGDLGADVIKVEPPGGSPSRLLGPFLEDGPEAERSLQFFSFNRNKRSITLDLETEAGRDALFALAEKADFLIESARPGEMAQKGLGFEAMRRANPRIIYVAITPFGQDGPRANIPASDLTIVAMGGPMSLQGHPDRAPVRLSLPQAWLHASVEASVGALTAHALMLRTGEAQFVDVSAQTAMIWTMLQGMIASSVQGRDFNRAGNAIQLGTITLRLVHECADGYVVIFPIGGALSKLVEWCVQDGIVPEDWLTAEDWPMYHFKVLQQQPVSHSIEEVVNVVGEYVKDKTKNQLLERGLAEGVSMAPVNNIEDLTRFRHLEERGYWINAPLPNGQRTKVPGIFATFSRTPMNVRHWPPRLGEHTEEILGNILGFSPSKIASASGQAKA